MSATDVADLFRTVILFVGFVLAMTCLKFGVLAWRNGEGWRTYGLASYAFLVITPAIIGLYRFEQPLIVPAAITYTLGMVFGIIALRTSYTIRTGEWARLRRAERERQQREDA